MGTKNSRADLVLCLNTILSEIKNKSEFAKEHWDEDKYKELIKTYFFELQDEAQKCLNIVSEWYQHDVTFENIEKSFDELRKLYYKLNPPPIEDKIKLYFVMIQEGEAQSEKAQELRKDLEQSLGKEHKILEDADDLISLYE